MKEEGSTHDTTTFTRVGQTQALNTLQSGLALAREREERQRKMLVDADQRMKLMWERRATAGKAVRGRAS